MRKRKIRRRWEVNELKFRKIIKVPTRKEKIKKGLSDKEWIMICYRAHKNEKCIRELFGHSFCELCPKKEKI
jgi:predicted DNA-binding transcriptional regulator